jgi:hypothetical protein
VTIDMGEWRKVESTVSDGPGQDRTETSYVFGAEFDGVFVPAVTKASGYFEHLVQRGKDDAQSQQDAPSAGQTDAGTANAPSTGTGQQVPPTTTRGGSKSGGA